MGGCSSSNKCYEEVLTQTLKDVISRFHRKLVCEVAMRDRVDIHNIHDFSPSSCFYHHNNAVNWKTRYFLAHVIILGQPAAIADLSLTQTHRDGLQKVGYVVSSRPRL